MSHSNRHLAPKLTRDLPLKCDYCGEAWMGTVAGIGRYCDQNPSTLIGRPGDVRQCRIEELTQDIDWDVEVF